MQQRVRGSYCMDFRQEKGKIRNEAEIRTKENTQLAAKTEKNGKEKIKPGTIIKEGEQITAKNPEQKKQKKAVEQ